MCSGSDVSLQGLATMLDFGDGAAFAETKVSRDVIDRKAKRVDAVKEMNSSYGYYRLADNLGSRCESTFISCSQRSLGRISSM